MGFWSSLFGFDDRQAPPQVVNQATKFPEELAPYIKELLGEAQTLYGAQKEEGYQPYTGETIAPLTPEELQAQEGLKGLIGTAQPYLKEALETYRTGAEKFTPEAAQEYMSPYQRAVTDIEKREAQKVFERDVMPRFEKQAVQAGGMSGLGSRAAIQAGQLGQAQMQQMGDIEAKGLQKSYMDAQKLFAEQKARERTVAGDIGRTGTGLYQAGLADQGLLQDIGQQKRELGQAALDEAYYKFLKEQSYPQDIISQYSGTVYGAPSPGPSYTKTTTGNLAPYQPGVGQQLMGLGLAGLNIYGMGGGFKPGGFDMANIWKKEGGGLSNLPVVRRQTGGPNKPSLEWLARYGRTPKIRHDAAKELGLGEDIIKKSRQRGYPYWPHRRPPPTPLSTTKKALAALSQNTGLPPGTFTNVGTGGPGEFEGTGPVSPQDAPAPASSSENIIPQTKKDADNKTLIERLTQRGVDMLGEEVPSAQALERLKKEKSKEPSLNVELQRKRGEDLAKKKAAVNKALTTERTAIQEEWYTEESEAMTDYLDKNKELIEELGGYPGDIIGDAIDKGMEERGIVGMLTKTLNVTAKGLGERNKEINSELRKLSKDQFQMEKELRKGKRTDKLANLEKKAEVSLRKIIDKAGLQTKLDDLPAKAKQAAYEELKNIAALRGSEYKKLGEVVSMVDKLERATAAGQGGKAFTAPEKQIDELINKLFGVTVHTDGSLRLGGEYLTSNMPQFQKYQKALKTGRRVYKQTLVKTGDQRIAQLEAEAAVYETIGTGDGTPPANYPNAKKSPKDGHWYIPDPKRQGKFLKVS